MVKNTSGGTKTKGLARKHTQGGAGGGGGGGTLRIPHSTLEQVVIVTKMLGNGMCEVFNNDDQRFIAHIRNKFKGRHRRSNDISVNTYILIGLREWENPFKNCDVIFVYDHVHFSQLASNPSIHIQNIHTRDTSIPTTANNHNDTNHNDTNDTNDTNIVFNDNDNLNDHINDNDNLNINHNIDTHFILNDFDSI
jgi:translation initiation factor IF-1